MYYVTATDEEGFNTAIIGPFKTYKAADKWASKMESSYEGDLQEPYQAFPVTTPKDFEDGFDC